MSTVGKENVSKIDLMREEAAKTSIGAFESFHSVEAGMRVNDKVSKKENETKVPLSARDAQGLELSEDIKDWMPRVCINSGRDQGSRARSKNSMPRDLTEKQSFPN